MGRVWVDCFLLILSHNPTRPCQLPPLYTHHASNRLYKSFIAILFGWCTRHRILYIVPHSLKIVCKYGLTSFIIFIMIILSTVRLTILTFFSSFYINLKHIRALALSLIRIMRNVINAKKEILESI